MNGKPTVTTKPVVLIKVTCIKCGKPFHCRKTWPRKVCETCTRKRCNAYIRNHRKKLRKNPNEEHMKRLDSDGVSRRPLKNVAQLQKVSAVSIHLLERRALSKIREHPDARRLFEVWKKEGCPIPEPPDPGEKLLEWHLQIADWWALYDELRSQELFEEAAEMLEEIDTFYNLTLTVLAPARSWVPTSL